MAKYSYGEILFLGECNCHCYYCLSAEMYKLQVDKPNQLNTHFKDWINFNKFIDMLKESGTDTIFLSSVITEPLLYKYTNELVSFLKENGFKVGIRTNGYFVLDNLDVFKELDAEISLSVNSLFHDTNTLISNNSKEVNWLGVLEGLSTINKKCRVSIVVNRFNFQEIPYMLAVLSKFTCISYIQLRKVYRYSSNDNALDIKCFDFTVDWLRVESTIVGSYFESEVYNYNGLLISLWRDVFKKESMLSLNYFTDGLLSSNNLLIPAYEEGECE